MPSLPRNEPPGATNDLRGFRHHHCMRLYSYTVTHDTGFSPNPFWGCCTLADCKPTIRRTAHVGDWIVGLSPKAKGHKLIYAMQVAEILRFEAYFRDGRFAAKIPDFTKGAVERNVVLKCGDNIYKPLLDHPDSVDDFQQLQSMHSLRKGPLEDPESKRRDLSGRNVLVSWNFCYFGSQPLDLPDAMIAALKVGRNHKSKFSDEIVEAFIEFIGRQPTGVNAPPSSWPQNNDSWKTELK